MLTKTRIEYGVNSDASPRYTWPIFTGCGQPPSVCLTRAHCWARSGHHRFGKTGWAKLYNPDFSPKFNDDLLEEPFRLRKPARILVGFTGDMFGPGSHTAWIWDVLNVVRATRARHTYLFLTKSPKNLAQFNPWPPNAWIGTSITGAESWKRQKSMYNALLDVEGGKRWISYEPMLGKWTLSLEGISWLVAGEQSGPGAVRPDALWLRNILDGSYPEVRIWIKKNLLKLYPELPKRQELP